MKYTNIRINFLNYNLHLVFVNFFMVANYNYLWDWSLVMCKFILKYKNVICLFVCCYKRTIATKNQLTSCFQHLGHFTGFLISLQWSSLLMKILNKINFVSQFKDCVVFNKWPCICSLMILWGLMGVGRDNGWYSND